jgi:hypothetical protein
VRIACGYACGVEFFEAAGISKEMNKGERKGGSNDVLKCWAAVMMY